MDSAQKKMPVSITVISCIFLVVATLTVRSAVKGLSAAISVQSEIRELPPIPEGTPLLEKLLDPRFPACIYLAILQIILAILIFIAGVQLLRLRKWARDVLEIICWLWLVCAASFTVFTASQSLTFPAALPLWAVIMLLLTVDTNAGMLLMLLMCGPIFILLIFLRRKTIKEAVGKG